MGVRGGFDSAGYPEPPSTLSLFVQALISGARVCGGKGFLSGRNTHMHIETRMLGSARSYIPVSD